MKKRFLTVLLALTMVLCFLPEILIPTFSVDSLAETEVTKETVKAPKPKKVSITGPKKVAQGKKITLTAEISPENANQKVTWSSSDKQIATVSSKGVVKGIKPGKVTITATSKKNKKVKKSVQITVQSVVSKIEITNAPKKLDVSGKNTAKLKIKVEPSSADKSVTWKSSNPDVATVSSKGAVKAVSPGKVTITAKAADGSKKKASVTINVIDSGSEPKPTNTPAPTAKPTAEPTAEPTATPVPISYGSITGNVTYHYNQYVGYKPDTNAKVLLIPRNGDAKSFDIPEIDFAIASSSLTDYNIYAATVDGTGNYTINHIPEGKYSVVIISWNCNVKDYFEASDKDVFFADRASYFYGELNPTSALHLSEAISMYNYTVKGVTIYGNEITTVSHAFPYTYI